MKTGVWGGTFDPPHLGHLVAASDAADALGLDVVLWVVSAAHPLKKGAVRTPAEVRLEMVRAAIAGDPRFEASGLELEREGPSYTVDTLRELHGRRPGGELFFLTGADNLRDFPRWKEPAEIQRLARLVVLSRQGEQVTPGGAYGALPVQVTRVDVSATEVRRRVAAGETIRYLVPDAVGALIRRHGLYRDSAIL